MGHAGFSSLIRDPHALMERASDTQKLQIDDDEFIVEINFIARGAKMSSSSSW
jgi:hypothetical protein